jgi:hypothetical protein
MPRDVGFLVNIDSDLTRAEDAEVTHPRDEPSTEVIAAVLLIISPCRLVVSPCRLVVSASLKPASLLF